MSGAGPVPFRDPEPELVRIRDRLHNVEKSALGLELIVRQHVAALEELSERVSTNGNRIDELERADDIAAAIVERRGDLFSLWQKALVIVLTVANLVAVGLGIHAAVT